MESFDEPKGSNKLARQENADRDQLVNDIKSRIRNGTYVVDSYKVADKFLRETLATA